MKNTKAILFDLDGTLIDSEICHYKCWNALLESFGPHLEYPHYLKFYSGVSMQTNAQKLIDEFKIQATPAELIERREKLILETLQAEDIQFMPYAQDILTYFLRLDIPLALVTSSSRAEVAVIMPKTKLDSTFLYVVTRDDVNHTKPNPEPYQKAVAILGCSPGDCVAVEDTLTGVQSAKTAGLTCLAVQPDFSAEFQNNCTADALFENLEQVKEYICDHFLFNKVRF